MPLSISEVSKLQGHLYMGDMQVQASLTAAQHAFVVQMLQMV